MTIFWGIKSLQMHSSYFCQMEKIGHSPHTGNTKMSIYKPRKRRYNQTSLQSPQKNKRILYRVPADLTVRKHFCCLSWLLVVLCYRNHINCGRVTLFSHSKDYWKDTQCSPQPQVGPAFPKVLYLICSHKPDRYGMSLGKMCLSSLCGSWNALL